MDAEEENMDGWEGDTKKEWVCWSNKIQVTKGRKRSFLPHCPVPTTAQELDHRIIEQDSYMKCKLVSTVLAFHGEQCFESPGERKSQA